MTLPASTDIQGVLTLLLGGGLLDEPLAERIFELILTGHVNDAQLGALLAFISARGATVDELVSGVRVLRRHMVPVPVSAHDRSGVIILDTCGTGGGPKVFNVSTVAAFVVAAAAPGRVSVAKHGGKSRTGRGSAEVLEHLGVNILASPTAQAASLELAGICFSFAPHHHPAMRHAAAARKSLGFPTIFNLIGPLSNPAGATHQLIGTFDPVVARTLVEANVRLGSRRSLVVTSQDGLDELTTTAPNELLEASPAGITERTLDPRELGFPRRALAELQVHTLAAAAALFTDILAGTPSPAREMVELNAAAALWVAGVAPDLHAGVHLARAAIDSGVARATFVRMRDASLTPA